MVCEGWNQLPGHRGRGRGDFIWVWVGPHDEYRRLIKRQV